MAEAEASSSRSNTHSELTESDMAAAHQLMQLSDEDNYNSSIIGKRNRSFVEEEEVGQSLSDLTSTKIKKNIIWKDEVFGTKKQRRYRSLVHIYMATTPINA